MRTIIIHGDYLEKSYERLSKLLSSAKQSEFSIVRVIEQKKYNLSEQISTKSLIKGKRLFLIEDIKKVDSSQIDWLKNNHQRFNNSLIVYNKGSLSKTVISKLPGVEKNEEYKTPKLLYKFMESFYPGNANLCIKILKELLVYEKVELVFAILTRYLKDLYLALIDVKSLDYPSWRVNKLSIQAKKFSQRSLKRIINDMAKADLGAKRSSLDINTSLDLIIATQLE